MQIGETVRISMRNLRANKLRSALAVLGIVIGVASFVSMLAIGEGAKQRIVREIEALGTNVLIAEPSSSGSAVDTAASYLSYTDYLRLQNELRLIEETAPAISQTHPVIFQGRTCRAAVEGTTPSYRTIRNHTPREGRFLIAEDIAAWERVAVIGSAVAAALFQSDNPLGKDILVAGQRFVVVGVLEHKPQTMYVKFNDKILIPVTTAMQYFTGNERLDKIQFRVRDPRSVAEAAAEVKAALIRYHDGREDVVVSTQEQFLSTLTETSRTLKILLGTVAAIALVVGGIGIMNIMLVSVTERTREIGLRMALGAMPSDILRQFLLEALTLALVGGVIGTGSGVLFSAAAARIFTFILPGTEVWDAAVTAASILTVLVIVVLVGVTAGLVPAHKASRMDPAEALRYE